MTPEDSDVWFRFMLFALTGMLIIIIIFLSVVIIGLAS